MTNKTAFLKLWKWAKWYFRMRWFKRKSIDAFLKDGSVVYEDGQLYLMRKAFETIEGDEIITYILKIEFIITKRPHIPF